MGIHALIARALGTLTCASLLLIDCSGVAAQAGVSRSFDRSIYLEASAATSASVSAGDVNADGHQDIVLVKGRHWPLENLGLRILGC